ncbi:hypothetical protein NDU88_002075 [Pleurodeles waltl]|uniref:Uncharacterized protein n=1 Tax=Pleurodeles waltl TaxID=8319 RepID=A0AAV7P8F3_PLEWA|nr:hypothetical protein NDU88_002075 [Pleurodeles waltl]
MARPPHTPPGLLPHGRPAASSPTPAQPQPPHLHQGPFASATGWRTCRYGGRHPIRRLPRRAGAAFPAVSLKIKSSCFTKKPQGLHDAPVHLTAIVPATMSSDTETEVAGPERKTFKRKLLLEADYDDAMTSYLRDFLEFTMLIVITSGDATQMQTLLEQAVALRASLKQKIGNWAAKNCCT